MKDELIEMAASRSVLIDEVTNKAKPCTFGSWHYDD